MADAKPGPFGLWRQMRAERKARETMTTEMPPDIAAEITADAAGLHDPQPVRGRSESLREFLLRTPHKYERDLNDRMMPCVCGLGPLRSIHYPVDDRDLLDTHAYITARLEEIRAGWPVPVPEAVAEERGTPERPRWYGTDEYGRVDQSRPLGSEDAATEPAPPPDGVLGYLVACARTDGGVTGVVEGVTHTSPMDLESARREARKYGVSSVRRWFPVELRRVDGG